MEYYVFIAVILVFVLAVFIKGTFDEKKKRRLFEAKLRTQYGNQPDKNWKSSSYDHMEKYHEKHKGGFEIDDITWNDLGMDQVFARMDYTLSRTGAEYLYHVLRTPCFSKDRLEEMEQKIRYFMKEEEDRVRLQMEFVRLGTMEKYSLFDYLDNLEVLGKRSNWKHYICNFLYLPAIFLMLLSPGYGILLLMAVAMYNLMSYFKEQAEIDPFITCFAYIMRLLHCGERMGKLNIPVISRELEEMASCKKIFHKFFKGSYIVMSTNRSTGSPIEIVFDYLRMIFHMDLIKFNKMLSEIREHKTEIDRMITVAGSLEVLISIGAFRSSLKEGYCIPAFSEGQMIHMQNGYHVLVSEPVKNSFTTEKGMLLTGSNASGKSTFLKTVALNALLAQTVYTSMAEQFVLPLCRIYSSMALRDDLLSGESYYIVEIKSLKRILEAVSEVGKVPVLCFVDEVLRGTNTVERIAASTELLKSLSGQAVLSFAATHDVELTYLLEKEYANYHFEEEIINGDVQFSYQLLEDRAHTRNAIKLLEVMGYENTIIERAQRRAEQFLEKGNWEV